KRLYYDALLARYAVEIAEENRQTYEQLLQYNQVRFDQGALPEAELLKVRLERVKLDSSVKEAQLNLKQAVNRLAAPLGDTSFPPRTVAGELDFSGANPSLDSLRQTALSERSDIQAALREIDAAKGRLALENARARSDITPYAGYKRVGVDDTVLVGVS